MTNFKAFDIKLYYVCYKWFCYSFVCRTYHKLADFVTCSYIFVVAFFLSFRFLVAQ